MNIKKINDFFAYSFFILGIVKIIFGIHAARNAGIFPSSPKDNESALIK